MGVRGGRPPPRRLDSGGQRRKIRRVLSVKSIKQKLLVSFLILVAVAALLCGGMGCISNYVSAKSTMVQMLEMTVGVAAQRVEYQLKTYETAATSLGMVPGLTSAEKDNTFKANVVQRWADYYGMERGNLLDARGYSFMDGTNYADREYFQRAMAGETYVSSPTVSKVTGELTVIVAAPLWQDGVQGSTVVGVVYLVPYETFLVDIMNSLLVSENGNAYMIDADGYTIADTVIENIGVENIEEDAKTDPALEELAALNAEMRQGKSGVGSYEYNGVKNKMLAYTPVENTDGWAIAITAPASDFLGTTYKSIAATIILMAVVLAAAVLVSIRIARGIGGPVKACAERLALLQEGDLTSPVPVFDSKDEIGTLSRGTNIIVTALKEVIEDVGYLLKEMGSGNFAVTSRNPEVYKCDFAEVYQALNDIKFTLSGTLQQIGQAADQVSAGAEQVSSGAQALAQGATEQASAVQELSASINEIDSNAKSNAQAARDARSMMDEAVSQVRLSHEKMTDLRSAMGDILGGHQEISQIISTIENIAFQTNILALNAAVEAARAGSSGKGFAVVADEVRNLASKSDEAAKQTKLLIEQSTLNVERGSQLTEDVSASLDKTTESAGNAQNYISQVVDSIVETTDSIDQVTTGVDQISSVVQTNSATAEESAAASEELSGQSQIMKELVDHFTLPEDAGGMSSGREESYSAPPRAEAAAPQGRVTGSPFDKY